MERNGTIAMMNRRTFLGVAAGIAGLAAAPPADPLPIIDTHIHLFDPRRPQGVPWPDKNDATLYQPALPDRYRKVTKGLGVVGTIEVGCSRETRLLVEPRGFWDNHGFRAVLPRLSRICQIS